MCLSRKDAGGRDGGGGSCSPALGTLTARMPLRAWPEAGAGLRASFLGQFSGCLQPVTVNSPELLAEGSRGWVRP